MLIILDLEQSFVLVSRLPSPVPFGRLQSCSIKLNGQRLIVSQLMLEIVGPDLSVSDNEYGIKLIRSRLPFSSS